MDPETWQRLFDLSRDVRVVRINPLSRQLTYGSDLNSNQAANIANTILPATQSPRTTSGMAAPTSNYRNMVAALWSTEPQSTEIHERLGHGSIGRAEQTGKTGQLDWPGRAIAAAQYAQNPAIQGLGILGDEARAYGLERAYPTYQAGGSQLQQGLDEAKGAFGDFLFHPNRAQYYSQRYLTQAKDPRGYAGWAGQDLRPESFQAAGDIMGIGAGLGGAARGANQFVNQILGLQ